MDSEAESHSLPEEVQPPLLDESVGKSDPADGHQDSAIRKSSSTAEPNPPASALSSTVSTARWRCTRGMRLARVEWMDPPHVGHSRLMPCSARRSAASERELHARPQAQG